MQKYYFDKSDIEDESKITEFGEIINTLMLLVRYPSRLGETRRKKHAEHIQSFMKELERDLKVENILFAVSKIFIHI